MKKIQSRYFSSSLKNQEIFPYSTIKIIKNDKLVNKIKKENVLPTSGGPSNSNQTLEHNQNKEKPIFDSEYRENEMKIQMLSSNLFKQIFKHEQLINDNNQESITTWQKNILRHGMKLDESIKLPNVSLKLPKLKGLNIEEHFRIIAGEQSDPYKNLINDLLCQNDGSIKLPSIEWSQKPGWTRYDKCTMKSESIAYPDENALIFDVEVCVIEGKLPTIACALGKHYWYTWVSKTLFETTENNKNTVGNISSDETESRSYYLNELIPLESSENENGNNNFKLNKSIPKIIIGHNVSYDRARIKEQYLLEQTALRFLDTMSLHVCVSGITSYQRAILKSTNKELSEEDMLWSEQSSLNSLVDVYNLYCNNDKQQSTDTDTDNDTTVLDKSKRNIFFKGTIDDVRKNFQDLMSYCANDVLATYKVLIKLYPMFIERFPHPATFAGMLEIGMAYLPINSNWKRYINESNLTYEDLNIEAKHLLKRCANQACRLQHNDEYKNNLWMWDEDWSRQQFKFKKITTKERKAMALAAEQTNRGGGGEDVENIEHRYTNLEKKFSHLYNYKNALPAKRPLLSGYPNWYRKLCVKSDSVDWTPGPHTIGTGMQIAPKILSLCWEGYPLHNTRENGWGFLVPFKLPEEHDTKDFKIPLRELVKKCPVIETNMMAGQNESDEALSTIWKDVESNLSRKDFYRKKKLDKTNGLYTGTGIWCNTMLDDCCWFIKLPHKNGVKYRVGNPLAKDFLNKFSENVLSGDGRVAENVIEIARMLSYWRNNKDRIVGQMVVWHNRKNQYGAIIPQVVVCGTLTRRAMEPTWMTASNAQRERIGSELRGMVQAPSGYKIVGADVDSQELWIASVLGDASETGLHGATPFGWMTLSGTKAEATDMHSVTAKAIGISRDHAKVINYARIYGAGQMFAERLLKQFNPTISDGDAKSKAMKMFLLTKGRKLYELLPEYKEYDNKKCSGYQALKIAAANGKSVSEMFRKPKWEGGTESAMFNRLEEIAGSAAPVTPFLQCRLSRALEPPSNGADDKFLPTRVNWVVQSGAVDYLHLMLVCMRWLMGSNIRFCLSFHDEIRYMVADKFAYKTALAMHITNLLTRSFCAHRIGLKDLPQSVAFFASVEVDTVLRKEATLDCKTPSNPHGLSAGYDIPNGESLDIHQAIEKTTTDGGNVFKI